MHDKLTLSLNTSVYLLALYVVVALAYMYIVSMHSFLSCNFLHFPPTTSPLLPPIPPLPPRIFNSFKRFFSFLPHLSPPLSPLPLPPPSFSVLLVHDHRHLHHPRRLPFLLPILPLTRPPMHHKLSHQSSLFPYPVHPSLLSQQGLQQ